MEVDMSGFSLMISDAHGVYIPQYFTQKYDRTEWGKISDWAWDTCAAGPDAEHYWDAWTELCDSASHTDAQGNVWNIYQDGDVWAYCDALMTDEEYENFFGERREAA
jgi:hypothetical protein